MSPLNIIIAVFVLVSLFSSFRKGAAKRAEQMEALKLATERTQSMPPRPGAAASQQTPAFAQPRLREPYVSPYSASTVGAPSEGIPAIPMPVSSGGRITGTTFEGMGTEGEQDELHAAHVPLAMSADLDARESLAQVSLAELRRAVVLSGLLGPPRAHRRAGRATH